MSEAPAERPTVVPARTPPAGGNFLTRKVAGLPTWGWLAIIGVGGAVGWYLWQRHNASTAATTTAATTTAGAAASGNCTDSSGNAIPCDQVDYGGQIATLQTEIQDLQQGVSTSESQTTVPQTVGMTVQQAQDAIKSAGLLTATTGKADDKVKSTTPAAGKTVAKGSVVEITPESSGTSTGGGASQVTVPRVTNLEQATAVARLKAAGLNAKPTSRKGLRRGAILYVVRQDPVAGAKADRGSTVTLTSYEKGVAGSVNVSGQPAKR